MATKKAHTAELMKLAGELPALIEGLEADIAAVSARMAELKKAGLVYASEHWRKDANDEPKYFYLLYPQKHGEPRRRDYIGCDAAKIAEARAGIARAKEYDELAARLSSLSGRVHHVAGTLQDARRYLTSKR
ncbi:hypothetical protein UNR30_004664 [Salmonella enterica]|jgi:DNA-binding transcriptional ArsR family regulator|uniref:Uncharacterized protein n=1 Tax=bioreactor metagenome TaxID=1076179 RepID=A0A645ELP6_9ZZZZ|nr:MULTISPECIES: hypothetical protein [Pseudomonadota]EFR2202963.1 hypothetical protein [Salmonella enterica]EHH7254030.1 hypothetical protein [Escherichia coli]BBE29102.1 hypothetical protein [uncultured bacterium]ELZ4141846.1 hypothetical protein [Salmonella enterica]MCW5672122.1 hypothetical protein [Hydrogenophaga sp.]